MFPVDLATLTAIKSNLEGSSLENSQISGNLTNINLKNGHLPNAHLAGASFRGADLTGASQICDVIPVLRLIRLLNCPFLAIFPQV